ncbi:MAG: glycosyltransferase family 2 protein, partial [Acidobacteriota bacterium]
SGDDSVQVLKKIIQEKRYSGITFIENQDNVGFAKGCNIGTKKAMGKYLLFLNNDTLVKDRGILEMAEYLDKHSTIAILGGSLLNPDGTAQPSIGSFYSPIKVMLLLLGLQRYGLIDKNPQSIKYVDWVKGALLMIRKEVFEKLHGFDEHIFMYTEDMELCYRAKLQGYLVAFYPKVHVIHEESGSSDKTFAIVHIYKNLLYFYKKHRSRAEYLFVRFLLRAKAVTLIGIGRLTRNSYFTHTYEEALKVT